MGRARRYSRQHLISVLFLLNIVSLASGHNITNILDFRKLVFIISMVSIRELDAVGLAILKTLALHWGSRTFQCKSPYGEKPLESQRNPGPATPSDRDKKAEPSHLSTFLPNFAPCPV